MVSFDQRLIIPRHVLVREIDGESVLLNVESERYFGLDSVGTTMWAHLTTEPSIQAAYDALLAQYAVDADTLRADLTQLVETLLAHGLIDLQDAQNP